MPRDDWGMGDLAREDRYDTLLSPPRNPAAPPEAVADALATVARNSEIPSHSVLHVPGKVVRGLDQLYGTPSRAVRGADIGNYPEGSEEAEFLRQKFAEQKGDWAADTARSIVLDPFALAAMKGNTGGFMLGSGAVPPLRKAPGEEAAGVPTRIMARSTPGGYPPEAAEAAKYLNDPQRVAFPGVYKDPRVLAQEAAANVAPEHPALKQLFGVTRDDLWEIGGRGTRKGNIEPSIWMPSKGEPKSYAASAIMTPANAQRMVDALAEAEKYPQLTRGMDAWYVMDPAFQHMVKLVGYDRAVKDYTRFNMTVPPFSAGSNVLTEINRGTAANMMAARGEFPKFEKYAGMKEADRGKRFPAELRDVMGHAYHGVQADPVTRYLATGAHGYHPDTVKIPLYTQASGVPEIGFQTRLPVPDAHFARASGMADVRKSKSFADYMGGSEYRPYGPWYRENVAKPLGIEAVPAQGRMWGLYAPQTGVDTAVGAPKLELLSQAIWERAQKLGIDPYKLRDDVLRGKAHATWLLGGPAAGAAAYRMGDLAEQGEYRQ